MNIAIDAREFKTQGAGKSRYVAQIILSLAEVDTKNNYFLLSSKPVKAKLPDNFKWLEIPNFPYFSLGSLLKKHQIDLFFSPTSYLMALFSPKPTIIVVHDLAVFIEKRARPTFKTRLIEKLTLPLVLKKARRIITVSENTRKDILSHFKTDPAKIVSIPSAPLPSDNNAHSREEVVGRYQLSKRYILYVGTIEPRKNLDGLIMAYGQLPAELRNTIPLILVGKRGWNVDQIDQAIKQSPARSTIRELGFVPDQDLPEIYRQASVFVYPSCYEGFGFPVLEAMAKGVPVITSNISSLPEVAGDAAILIDPADPKELTRQIETVLSDNVRAAQLKQAGLKRARQFSWERTARETVSIFDQITERV